MDKLVSVVIPTKNREVPVIRALKSVFNQSYKQLEVIVVDDGSTDNTQNVISQQYPDVIIIYNHKSKGGAIARNQGAQEAKGEYLAFLDSDDEWEKNHLHLMVETLINKELSGAFSAFCISYNDGQSTLQPSFRVKKIGENILLYILKSGDGGDIRTSTMVFMKAAFMKLKFDESFSKYQDWDLAIRFDQKFNFGCSINRSVVLHVNSSDRMSAKTNLQATQRFFEKHFFYFPDNLKFYFYLKLAYKSSIVDDRDSPFFIYAIDRAKKYIKFDNTFKNRLKLFIINFPLFNIGRTYFLTKRFIGK